MSKQGWRDFLNADGLDDWVVLHGGPTAVFVAESFAQATELASSIAKVPGLDQQHTQLSIVSNRVTVRLTREIWIIEPEHAQLAREVSKVAQSLGAVADPKQVQEVQLAIAAKPAAIDLDFWRAVLGYDPMLGDNAIDPLGFGSTVWMQELDSEKPLKHAMHIDVSVAREHVQARLEAALQAGGVLVDDSAAPAHWILADRSGNKVCICAWPDGSEDPSAG